MGDLEKALRLHKKVGRVFIATASAEGQPHLAVAAKFALAPDDQVVVTEWFCPTTVANLGGNPRVALVVWDRLSDEGYQIVGTLDRVVERAIADGYLPEEEIRETPQVERDLWVKVDQMLQFTEGPHADQPG